MIHDRSTPQRVACDMSAFPSKPMSEAPSTLFEAERD